MAAVEVKSLTSGRNRILVSFRESKEKASNIWVWLNMLDRPWLFTIYGEDYRNGWTLAEIHHARRVLGKLAGAAGTAR